MVKVTVDPDTVPERVPELPFVSLKLPLTVLPDTARFHVPVLVPE
jgi:hypothetical protein